MTKKFSKFILGGLIVLACYQTVNAQTVPRVELENTESLTYTSKTVDGQEYRLFINLPGSYKTNPTKIYSVIYLTDAQSTFTSFKGIYGNLKYDGFIPESVTVGITWGGINPNISALRARDFLTTTNASPATNGGAQFLAFIKNELIPFIKSKYRVNDDRTLIGNSFGGFFTLYALFNEPTLFNRYIASSPTVTTGGDLLRTWETKYAAVGPTQPIRLFMGKGSVQDGSPTEFANLTERLKNVKNLEVKAMEIVDMGHASNTAETYSRGLLWVFKGVPIR
ncbi:MAG: alpha/beta hydrolase [Pedobacter sp.]|nr:MAG: alpha/beta hydrolase [Pedobacter sp.]